MKEDTFKAGDAVRVSAAFLRSICPSAAKGWPTTRDPGKGQVLAVTPCGHTDLVHVWFFDLSIPKTYNSANLVHDRDVYRESMCAEHRNEFKVI